MKIMVIFHLHFHLTEVRVFEWSMETSISSKSNCIDIKSNTQSKQAMDVHIVRLKVHLEDEILYSTKFKK